jgi:hypothetical protein
MTREILGNGGNPPFSRFGTAPAKSPEQGQTASGSMNMARFEALAFTVGFFMTGLLTFVALPLAA